MLFASIARSSNTADLYALIEGADTISVTVDVHASASCTDGVLNSPSFVGSATTDPTEPGGDPTTDAAGYALFDGRAWHRFGRVCDDHCDLAGGLDHAGSICLHSHDG